MNTGTVSPPGSGQKLDTLQVGRALAAQYVILFHAPYIMGERLHLQYDNAFLNAGHSGVEFFFVLSGFIMFIVHWRDIGQPDCVQRFAYNRFVRIYPLFWIVFAIFILGQLASGGLDPLLDGPRNVLRAVLLLPFDGKPPMTVAWTLSHELLFYILLGLCIVIGRKGLWIMAAWWAACLLALAVTKLGDEPARFPLSFLLSPYNLLFLMGMCAAYLYRLIGTSLAVTVLAAGLAGFALTILLDPSLPLGIRTLAYGLASASIVLGAARLEHEGRLSPPRWLVFMGDASYSTYLAHSVAIIAGTMAIRKLGLDLGPVPILALLIVIGTIGGIVLHLVVERPLMAALRRRRRRAIAL